MAGQATWRQMQAGDLATVAAISDSVHGRYTEPVTVYAERLALDPAGCLVLEAAGAVIGYLIAHPWHRDDPPGLGALLGAIPADATTCYLHDIALLPAARGAGAGRSALRFVLERARALGLPDVTLMAVGGADRFWSAQGFDYVRCAPGLSYGAGTHLMRMAVRPTSSLAV